MTVVSADGQAGPAEALEGEGGPDMRAVDRVAHRLLEARRAGARLVVGEVDPEMQDLIRLAGLPVEMVRQPEGRE